MLELNRKPLLWTICIGADHVRIQSSSIAKETILNQIRPISI